MLAMYGYPDFAGLYFRGCPDGCSCSKPCFRIVQERPYMTHLITIGLLILLPVMTVSVVCFPKTEISYSRSCAHLPGLVPIANVHFCLLGDVVFGIIFNENSLWL